ncbi:hypothetical protein H257_02959 [Aphanomyces astaci]|uniref:Uncharacterized protein n=1 Tax=Aphanomyces astaci TaxID=112090 RepID=W4H0M1_APHAT|nr:hypothetical protein H257_02959 [Aphanomyces astaci]ETV85101.1 hypothetical protein H257_02959 [Aphanomyces astaci]|eukprot:XP_009825119.1 hypothetical protein H257_02959 [Aphanomyces astaci]
MTTATTATCVVLAVAAWAWRWLRRKWQHGRRSGRGSIVGSMDAKDSLIAAATVPTAGASRPSILIKAPRTITVGRLRLESLEG